MNTTEEDQTGRGAAQKAKEGKETEERPNRGMEDWEFTRERDEPPLRVPYWFPIAVGALIVGAILLTLPWIGIRKGYERPWLDWGLLVGAGYGIGFLGLIYLFMKSWKRKSGDKTTGDEKKKR